MASQIARAGSTEDSAQRLRQARLSSWDASRRVRYEPARRFSSRRHRTSSTRRSVPPRPLSVQSNPITIVETCMYTGASRISSTNSRTLSMWASLRVS